MTLFDVFRAGFFAGTGRRRGTARVCRDSRPVAGSLCRGVAAISLDSLSVDHVETAMVRSPVLFVLAIAACFCAVPGSLNAQVTVVERTGPQTTAYSIFANQALGVSWSQTSPFTGVSVFATIGGVPGSGF